MGLREIRLIKEGKDVPKKKKIYTLSRNKPIPKKSVKRLRQEAQQKKVTGNDDTLKEKWFKARRAEMVGICQCGCGMPSQKDKDDFYRHSIAHIFPQRKFKSIQFHPLNWVERRFWQGCHAIMDDTSMNRWPGMADWDDIKAKFYILAPLLTDKERATKFYTHLKHLIDQQ